MKKMNCHHCGSLVMEINAGSQVLRRTRCYCGKCSVALDRMLDSYASSATGSVDMPDFLKELFPGWGGSR